MKKILSFLTISLLLTSFAFSQNPSNALEFDGIYDYVSIPNGTALIAGLSEFSMCAWVYPTNPNTSWPDFEGYFGIKNEGVCDFYLVQLYGLGLEARITTNVGQFTLNPADLSEVEMDEWQHFAIVYTGEQLQVFINGEFDNGIAASGTIDYDNLEMTIGTLKFQTNDFFLDGKMDEVTIWDKALTEEEIQEYMCIGGDPASIPNLTAYYDFNEEEGIVLPDYFGNYDGALTNMGGDEWIVSEVCESGFDATFTVIDSDSGLPVENASIDVDGLVKTTNENGVAIFTNYDPGVYEFTITKTDYYDYSSSFEIVDEDIIVEVSFDPILTYSITFIIMDNNSTPLENANVNLDGIIQFTNASGETTFNNYLPGSYPYSIIVEGFEFLTGTAEVIDEDLSIEIVLVIDDINQHSIQEMEVYPNPTSGMVNINLNKKITEPILVQINDLNGHNLRTFKINNKSTQIDLSDLNKGLYIIQYSKNGETSYSTLILK